jgi:hypothetical protein
MAAIDTSLYERQRRNIGEQYSRQAAINALGRFNAQQRGNRQIADYTQNFQRQTPRFTASYGRRGLTGGGVRSGVYQKALQNYVGDYNQGLNRSYADLQGELNQYDLNAAQLQSDYQRGLTDLEIDKAKEIANAAQYLNALKSQFGG